MSLPKALLLTGPPGSGKTTLVRKALERSGARAGGFYTVEIRRGGVRQGFDIVTLDGQRATLSHVSLPSTQRVGKYGVDVAALERVGVTALRRATLMGLLVVVDEIGKMELCSVAFREAILEALERGERLLGTIMQAPHPWADRIKKDPRVKVIPLTRSNKDQVSLEVQRWLQGGSHGPEVTSAL